jgi:hypothetical protein
MIGVSVGTHAFVKARIGSHVDLTTDDGLDPLLFAGFPECDRAVHDTVVGNGNGILPTGFDTRRDILDPAGAVKQTVFAMQM